jgi:membrane protein implicated in regulation of membrane protease activity
MAIEVAKYQFQSWVRRGIATQISEQDSLGNPAALLPPNERASVPIGVSVNGTAQDPKPFELVGPGDIIGIQRDMIVRAEPRHGIVNFEPNYLAFIEFYDEDFPWRYSPAKPDGQKLRPWILLLVLREDELSRDDHRLPLPVVSVKRKEALPRADETWLFAHAHLEQPIPELELSSLERYLKSLQETITTDPDKLYSRLLSPRHLEPNTAYQAFLVPAFEVGRLAGLGKRTAGVPAQKPAWDGTAAVDLPFYFDWSFRTGEKVDFEALVELIEPRVLDPRIGIRSMDCAQPGFVLVDGEGRERPLAAGDEPGLPAPLPPVQGLEGALKTNRTKSLPEVFTANAFQDELQILVNLPETIQTDTSAPPGSDEDFLNDPVVTLPFYGQNHARQHKADKVLLDVTKSGWYHDLNRDPRTRVAAGLGTLVIQKNQEQLMRRAWQQVQKVYEANQTVRGVRFILEVSTRYSEKFFSALGAAQLMAITSPVHAKVLGSPTTIRQQLRSSRLRAPVFGSAFRRLIRPAGKLARRFDAGGTSLRYSDLVDAVNAGRADPAPPREVPAGIPSLDDLAAAIRQPALPAWLQFLIRHRVAALALLLALLFLLAMLTGAWVLSVLTAVASVAGYRWLERASREQDIRAEAAAVLTDPQKAAGVIAAVPARPEFTVVVEGETAPQPPTPGSRPGGDSVEAANFRRAAVQLMERVAIRAPEPPPLLSFDLRNGQQKLAHAIDPKVSFPRRLSALVRLPNLSLDKPEDIVEAMTHPDFEDAMYGELRDISKELLIPNLDLIPPNTISLLETNPKFIESYLVGLNHEMGRELLWREYPTDLRGSYFRQFWEVKGVSSPTASTDADQLKDVTKLHTWSATSQLGSHRPPPDPNADVKPGEKQLVVVIRGELLKRYPNTVVYAQKAILDTNGDRVIFENDMSKDEFIRQLKFPLFRAEIDPDLRFFGFDLTIEKARGTVESKQFENDKLGWFFVIQEVPGEPRFGMDIAYEPTRTESKVLPDSWDNLAWTIFGAVEPPFVSGALKPSWKKPGNPDLDKHRWGSNAAEMAFALFQTPVMVAVHASEMLDESKI